MQANVSDEIRVGSLCYNGISGKGNFFCLFWGVESGLSSILTTKLVGGRSGRKRQMKEGRYGNKGRKGERGDPRTCSNCECKQGNGRKGRAGAGRVGGGEGDGITGIIGCGLGPRDTLPFLISLQRATLLLFSMIAAIIGSIAA
jgi:hypothetical protein